MINAILTKIVGSKNERTLKRMRPVVERINGLEDEHASLTDDQLRAKKEEFRSRLAAVNGRIANRFPHSIKENFGRQGRYSFRFNRRVWFDLPTDFVESLGVFTLHTLPERFHNPQSLQFKRRRQRHLSQ